MPEQASTQRLRLRILALLGLPTLSFACTPKGGDGQEARDSGEPERDGGGDEKATSAAATDGGDEKADDEGEAAADEGEAKVDEVEEALPPGANFCFAPAEAKTLAVEGSKAHEGGCPLALDPGPTSSKASRWSRRTGGPWDITVTYVHAEGEGARCCYAQNFRRRPGSGPSRGRPLLAEDGASFVLPDPPAVATPDDRARAGWLEDARAELASVAAFARANLELLGLAAPPELIHANLRAAGDEIEHARLCLARAGLAGVELGPTQAPSRRAPSLAELAEQTLLEACVPETLGALAAARAAEAARAEGRHADADAREQIAEDETRHAAVAWAVLHWALEAARSRGEPLPGELELRARAAVRDCADVEPELHGDDGMLWTELVAPLLSKLNAARAEGSGPTATTIAEGGHG